MLIDETKLLAFLVALVSGIFWHFLRSRDRRLEKIEKDIYAIQKEYQRTDAAHRDFGLIMASLDDIKGQLKQINDRLDKKADK